MDNYRSWRREGMGRDDPLAMLSAKRTGGLMLVIGQVEETLRASLLVELRGVDVR